MARKIGWLIFLLATVFNCDFFRPREPQPGGGGGDFQSPIAPGIVIKNLVSAYNSRNIDNYRDCFDKEHFLFLADPIDTLEPTTGSRFRNWNFAAEDSVTSSIFSALDTSSLLPPILLQLSPISGDSSADSARFYEQYELRLDLSVYKYCRGNLKFSLVKIDNFWYILTWEDFKTDTTDWAEIKAAYRR
jgi:hypothetical protein